ncbi:MAG: (Fe-S)-binding protein [Desulfobacteraceae bacterium]|nr:(Fe-S)-binding protein [Desulfobacteraceae bacterium]
MKKLAKLIKELEQDLLICVRCGACHAACPLYKITQQEGDVARGKLSLLDGLVKNLFSKPDQVNKILNKCLLCGSCAASCPSNVNVIQIFIKARIIITQYSSLSLFKKVVFRFFLSNPKRFNWIITIIEKFQFLVVTDNTNSLNTSSFRLISPSNETRRFRKIAKTPFYKTKYAKNSISDDNRLKVAFFPGCVIDKFYPDIAIDTVQILKHYKVDIYIPDDQGCCGIPALASGDKDTFNKLVAHNINLFSMVDFDYILTPCATCLSTIKEMWPLLYQPENDQEKKILLNLSSKSLDISQFLINILNITKVLKNNNIENITYHDPCHHKKVLNISNEPRELIKLSGQKFIEMEKSDSCCGMGGTFNLLHYDESVKIGNLKLNNIKKANSSVVATSCPACMMQLADIIAKSNSDVKVRHPIEIFKQALFYNNK